METREELLKKLGAETQVGLPSQCMVAFDKNYSNQELNDILAAPTQEQLDCAFCHPEYPSMSYQEFEYCPHCGRKLGDE